MAKSWEQALDIRAEKLEVMHKQIAAGELSVRQMTDAERERWAARDREFEANATAEERARRARAQVTRQKRAQLHHARLRTRASQAESSISDERDQSYG